jgi:hypothetical protein
MRLTTLMIIGAAMFVPSSAKAGEQTRFYDSKGNSIGTATPQGEGTIKYRDAGGRTLGTSTTTPGGVTTFYGSDGSVTGKSYGPSKGHR